MQTPTKRRNISCTWCSFFHARTCANRLVAAVQLDVCSLLHISRQCVSLRQDHVVEHVLSNYPAVMSELNNILVAPMAGLYELSATANSIRSTFGFQKAVSASHWRRPNDGATPGSGNWGNDSGILARANVRLTILRELPGSARTFTDVGLPLGKKRAFSDSKLSRQKKKQSPTAKKPSVNFDGRIEA